MRSWNLRVPAFTRRTLASKKTRFGQILVGHTFLTALDLAFDHGVYPFALYKLGSVNGFVAMTLASGLLCFLLVVLYERMGVDWLGVDVLEEVKEHGQPWVERLMSKNGFWWFLVRVVAWIPSRIFFLVLWLLKKNDLCAFLALSIYEDAFRTVVFLRHGKFSGLGKRDWGIFTASLIISNVYWTIRWSILIEAIKYVWRLF